MKILKITLFIVFLFVIYLFITNYSHYDTDDNVFSGNLEIAFENKSFKPNFSSEDWWVKGNIEPIFKIKRDLEWGGWPLCMDKIKIKGTITEKGRYGHMGQFDRELNVEEILEFSNPYGCHISISIVD